jgi:hypothetical protein
VASVISWLPPSLRHCLGHRGFLPTVITLKEYNPERPQCYSDELRAYSQLQSLQGDYIPQLYGEATVYHGAEKVPALLLEYIKGNTLDNLPLEHLASNQALQALRDGKTPSNFLQPKSIVNPKLLAALELTYDEITRNNLVHGDPKSDNFIAAISSTGHYRVWAIDLEFTLPPGDITNSMDFLSIMCELTERITPEEILDK